MLAKVGTSVLNSFVGLALPIFSALENVPWIAVPFDWIESTFPARTCWRKAGLYGIRTRLCACVARVAL